MKRRFFSGNTLEQAVMAAASSFLLPPERVNYSLVEKRHGFVKTPRRVVIEVDPANPEREPAPLLARPPAAPAAVAARPAASPRPAEGPARSSGHSREERRERRPRPERLEVELATTGAVRVGDAAEQAAAAMGDLLRLAGLDLSVRVTTTEEGLEVDLAGADRERLLAEEAELLEAIEYLLPRMLARERQGAMSCRVDSEGYRAEKERGLRALARETAERVRGTGQGVLLDTMGPAERRLVHLELKEDPNVTTESQGEGFFKRVLVAPR